MSSILITFVAALGASASLVPICRRLAQRLGYVAQPKADRWHQAPTPMLGGVAIGLVVLAGSLLQPNTRELGPLLAGVAFVFALGFADDLRPLKPSTKLIAEIGVAAALMAFGYRLNWSSSQTMDALLTIFWIVGITNAFNLLDNMDGLCGGIALIACGAFLAGLIPSEPGTTAFSQANYVALLAGAVAGFLVYNMHPASVFMGDAGSLLIGVSFAALPLGMKQPTLEPSALLTLVAVPVLVLLIPIFDTTLVTLSRLFSGRRPSSGGRDHSSHRLVAIGLSERTAVTVLWTLAVLTGMVGIATRHLSPSWSILIIAVFLLGMGIFAVYLGNVRVYDNEEVGRHRGRITPLVANFMYKRRVAEVLLDVCLIAIAYYAAYRLRFEGAELRDNFTTFSNSLPLVLAIQLGALFVVGAYRGAWRYFSLMDAVVFGKAVVYGTLASQLLILYLYRFRGYSRSVFAIYALMLFLVLVGSRASFRLIGEFIFRRRDGARRLVIYGAGDRGAIAVRRLLDRPNPDFRMLGFIDDHPDKLRMRVAGYPVLGSYAHLTALIQRRSADVVVLSARHLPSDRLIELERACAREGIALLRLHLEFEEVVGVPQGPRAALRGGRS